MHPDLVWSVYVRQRGVQEGDQALIMMDANGDLTAYMQSKASPWTADDVVRMARQFSSSQHADLIKHVSWIYLWDQWVQTHSFTVKTSPYPNLNRGFRDRKEDFKRIWKRLK